MNLNTAQLPYDLVLEGHIDWFYLAIFISQLGAIYSMKEGQKDQSAH